MPRTRIVTDQTVFEAAIQLVGQHGVNALTFASLSKVTSLAPPTLVQRFKTKKELLTATTDYCIQKMEPAFKAAISQRKPPLVALRQALVVMAAVITDAQAFANNQAFLQLGLAEPNLHRRLRSTMDGMRSEIEALLERAIASKELQPCDTRALARLLQSVYEGGTITWAVYQQEPIEQWIDMLLQTALAPYKLSKGR